MQEIHIGVRRLIEFVMRSGDIDTAYQSNRRMQQGIEAHQRIQHAYGEGYRSEVSFSDTTELEGIAFVVDGRADGVYENEDTVLIDEIKSTVRPLETLVADANPLHWAQAKCYAHFYCKQHDRSHMSVQLTYVNLDAEEPVKFVQEFTAEELAEFYLALLGRYLRFSRLLLAWKEKRNASLESAAFPYATYREGQRRLAVSVYEAIEKRRRLFVEAPTGIGKTMSTLFPAVLSLAHLDTEQIYYLTTKTTTQNEPARALALLAEQGVSLKSVQLTAKDKLCLNDKVSCNPNDCPYAKGHFDRVNDAILSLFQEEDTLTRRAVEAVGERFTVCPFELQLDMSSFSDVVLCDVNYFFDPRVYLRRAFEEGEPRAVLLVDEAHNLIDRSREMYSAELSTREMERMQEIFPEEKHRKLYRHLGQAMLAMEDFYQDMGAQKETATTENPQSLYEAARRIKVDLDDFLSREFTHPDYEEVRQFYFALSRFTKIQETWMDGFVNLLYRVSPPVTPSPAMRKGRGAHKKKAHAEARPYYILWRTQCIDTSTLLDASLARVRSAVFFSATLSPMSYYVPLLGGGRKPLTLHLPSPFPPENLRIQTVPLSTRYTDRAFTSARLAQVLTDWASDMPGNKMIFFPSYAYLRMMEEQMEASASPARIIQTPEMNDAERQAILERFRTEQGLLGFFVLGGVFSEGIDLPGEQLTGCAVVSVGMPGVSFERDVIRKYFDAKQGNGFDMAYTIPGMNRVLQAAGRVIRRMEDTGFVLLIDDRFATPKYRRLMPAHWRVD